MGYNAGVLYGSLSAGLDTISFWDEVISGRLTPSAILDGFVQLPYLMTHSGEAYDKAYLEYMWTLAMAINPYIPSFEDLRNFADNESLFWMRDEGAEKENASAWLQFAMRFWHGSVDAGILSTAIFAAVSAMAGGATISALKVIPQAVAMVKFLRGVVGTVWKAIKEMVANVKGALKPASLAMGRMWSAIKDAAHFGHEQIHAFAFKTLKEMGPQGIAWRVMEKNRETRHRF